MPRPEAPSPVKALLFVIPPNFIMAFTLVALPVLAPFLQKELGLTKSMGGFLVGAVQIGGIAALIMGWLCDRFGIFRVLFLGQVALALSFFAASRSNSFWGLFTIAVLIGVTGSVISPATAKAVVYWFSAEGRGKAIAALKVGNASGRWLGPSLLPLLAIWFNWRASLLTVSAVVLAWSLTSLLLGYSRYQAGDDRSTEQAAGRKIDLLSIFRYRILLQLTAVGFLWIGTQVTVNTYYILYLHEVLGYSILAASGFLATAHFVGIGGQLVWGFIGDRYFPTRRKVTALLLGILGTLGILLISILPVLSGPVAVIILSMFIGIAVYSWSGTLMLMRAESVPKYLSGTAAGLGSLGNYLGGFVLLPIFGLIVDLTGSYRLAWLGLVGFLLISLIAVATIPPVIRGPKAGRSSLGLTAVTGVPASAGIPIPAPVDKEEGEDHSHET
ncbi:MAG: MFS transporter [Chloroflexi bacterium]|nr:MFS transporter [Chloroflexota bacterium]